MKRYLLLFAVAILLFSCDKKDQTSPPGQPGEPVEWKAEAQSLLDLWLSSQNRGDFSLYSSVYDGEFTGIKRSGTSTWAYKHDNWLKDRKKMFARRMTVTMEDLALEKEKELILAKFRQTWESGTYEDQGPKIIIMKYRENRLYIVKEEMLQSTIISTRKETFKSTADVLKYAVYFILSDNLVVLGQRADPGWASGEPEEAGGNGIWAAVRRVNRKSLPDSVRSELKTEFMVYDKNNNSQKASVYEFYVYTGFIPHFGTLTYWEQEGVTEDERAQRIWEEGSAAPGGTLLVGKLDSDAFKGIWAHPASLEPPYFYSSVPPGAAKDALNREGKNLGEYKDFYSAYNNLPDEEKEYFSTEFTVRAYGYREERPWYLASFQEGNPCGADVFADINVIWQKGEEDKYLLSAVLSNVNPVPLSVFDLDHDGRAEFLFYGYYGCVYSLASQTIDAELNIPYYDCPC
ncbi:MAG: hypothetical protein JW969_14495 [Spirochaetales bacterium]|nr:hypothetical protein [Spirochaetales bacterium]